MEQIELLLWNYVEQSQLVLWNYKEPSQLENMEQCETKSTCEYVTIWNKFN